MTQVLLATDADWVADEVYAALAGDGTTVSRVRSGADVRPVVAELHPDLVVLDLQIGNMGGVATSIDLRHEAGAGRLPVTTILLLLDRPSDVWLAEEGRADGWLVKPIDSLRLRRAASAVLAGDPWFEGKAVPDPEADDAEPADDDAGDTDASDEAAEPTPA